MRNPAFDELRAKIPGVDDYAYFQTSGYSQKPEPVIDAVTHWLRFQAHGPALPHVGEEMTRRFEQTRTQVAAAVNADPDEIMLNENATVGINEVASGIDWRAGDNVVFSTHEHPGNRIPWYVRLVSLLFWIFAVYYTLQYLFPALRIELTSPP